MILIGIEKCVFNYFDFEKSKIVHNLDYYKIDQLIAEHWIIDGLTGF